MTNAQRQYQQSHHISLASDSERKSALKNAVDWWYANAQKLPGTLAELDFQFAEYKEAFGYYPSPENFGIHRKNKRSAIIKQPKPSHTGRDDICAASD
jgi:hypothetical protein